MKQKALVVVFVTITLGLPILATAQESLGDLARELRQQRSKAAKKPAKVYTNDDLPARPPQEGPTAASGMSSETPEGTSAETAKQGSPQAPVEDKGATQEGAAEDKIKTQDYWQGKFKAARAELASAEERQQLAEDELNLLQIQQARELNPATQSEVSARIKDKQAEIEIARTATSKARKALEDLEKQFKESGAPEDWSKTE